MLSVAQVDRTGNGNVGKFGGRIDGIGGFVNIWQGAERLVFVGTLKAGKQRIRVEASGIAVEQEAAVAKFVSRVEQISFSGDYAKRWNVPVTYVTERAVMELQEDGMVLTEVAPGLDLERDVFQQMDFRPRRSPELKLMDLRLFGAATMGLQLASRPANPEGPA